MSNLGGRGPWAVGGGMNLACLDLLAMDGEGCKKFLPPFSSFRWVAVFVLPQKEVVAHVTYGTGCSISDVEIETILQNVVTYT